MSVSRLQHITKIGVEDMGDLAHHFVENWRALMVVCEKGEMLQVYVRAQKE